jgi:hypothetical protein
MPTFAVLVVAVLTELALREVRAPGSTTRPEADVVRPWIGEALTPVAQPEEAPPLAADVVAAMAVAT